MLIESVPNVSEGRRREVVDRLAAAIRSINGVRLLDHSADTAHNRSVFTFVGAPEAVEHAALTLFAEAVAAIDMRTHRGEHPRIGAVDVVPFIPLEGATMGDCVAVAARVGRTVAERFGIPVFLYEESATAPGRRRLEDVRRGQVEGLAQKLASTAWVPDFGPVTPHPTAGATAIGARRPLIAFNVNLDTDRVDVASAIAAAIRESSGGLPAVKAIGVRLADGVQVSINLADYTRTSLARVFDAVVAEAARRGARVRESELIGLIPKAALAGTTPAHLQLTAFTDDRILENRLEAAGFTTRGGEEGGR